MIPGEDQKPEGLRTLPYRTQRANDLPLVRAGDISFNGGEVQAVNGAYLPGTTEEVRSMLMGSSEVGLISPPVNLLLARLSRHDRDLLGPHLEEVVLTRGEVVIGPDERLDAIYFLNTGIASIEERIGRRRHIEIAIVGSEGLLGWPALLGCERSCHSAVVTGSDGSASRIGLPDFLRTCQSSASLRMTFLNFVQTIIFQMGRSIASHLNHSLDQNVARWLLMRHDRVRGEELLVRHDEIADALGVRRASITDKMHILEGERLIRSTRGRLIIRDRAELERVAGEAYGQAEEHYRGLIAPFGKSVSGSTGSSRLTETMDLVLGRL